MILVDNEVIIAVMDHFEEKSNGRLINGAIYPMGDVVEIEVSGEVVPQKYCYTADKGVYENPNYVESYDEKQEIEVLKKRIEELESGILLSKGAI